MNALRRVVRARWLVLALFLAQVVATSVFAALVAAVVGASLRGHGSAEPGHMLYAAIDLVAEHPGVAVDLIGAAVLIGAGGLIGWTLVGPLIVAKLDGRWNTAEAVRAAAVALLPAFGTVLVFAVMRAVVVVAAAFAAAIGPAWIAVATAGLLTVMLTISTDVAVAAITLGRATVRQALARGFRAAGEAPRAFALAGSLVLGRWAVAAASLSLLGSEPWLFRAAALVTTVLGVLRLAVVVERFRPDVEPP